MTNSTQRIGAAVKSVSGVVSPLVDSQKVAGATMKMATPTVLNPGPRPRGPIEPTAQGKTTSTKGNGGNKGNGNDDKKSSGNSGTKGPTSMSK